MPIGIVTGRWAEVTHEAAKDVVHFDETSSEGLAPDEDERERSMDRVH